MNPIDVEVFRHLFQSIAEEMGVVLRRTAFSPNIKERLDFSCAVTGKDGDMVAQAAHIPVHLGACHLTARCILERVDLDPGDIVILNDPFLGGTHLPDITLFAPVFLPGQTGKAAAFGVLARAHHADVGGGVPGSMGDFDELYKEGLILPPVKLVRGGRRVEDVEALLLANVRTPDERRGDLRAQEAAVQRGVVRMQEAADRYGAKRLTAAAKDLHARAARAMSRVISDLPAGSASFEDRLDGPESPSIRVTLSKRKGRLHADFTGSSPQVASAVNAHESITLSALFYCLRCLAPEDVPTNSGLLEAVTLEIPEGSVVGARRPAAVAGGNVETSQRLVDVIFGAFHELLPGRIPAASQGSMNNLSLGGRDAEGRPFAYFETIAGGLGGGPEGPGASGMHSHMTNTLNTPIEALESALPLRVTAYRLRSRSGGVGRNPGGEGVVREIEALVPMTVTLMTTRRAEGPYGLEGGSPGRPGRNLLVRADGRSRTLPARVTLTLEPGWRIRVETPGGGGFGSP
ncbi:MAG TPA: hydantoinase B/oxoprolinase family protein [Planctomycetes bacterium]|nr:hydantoinase B/oxoprolinase family protein [Planctomycetota bacterium]